MSKRSHDDVHYHAGRLDKRCCNCTMYVPYESEAEEAAEEHEDDDSQEPPPHCTAVVDPIDPKGLCDLFERKEE